MEQQSQPQTMPPIESPPNYTQAINNNNNNAPVISPTLTPIQQANVNEKTPPPPQQSRIIVKSTDMSEAMQADAINLAKQAIANEQASPREMAGIIKREFDRLHQPSWHCIVGRSFGSFVTHEAGRFLFFYLDQWAILLFKTA